MVAIVAESPRKAYRPGPDPVARPHIDSGRTRARVSSHPSSRPSSHRSPRVAFVGCDEQRETRRRPVALRAWLMTLEGASRGYALDLSESGARLGGVCSPLRPGERALCKIELRPHEEPVIVRAEVVRNDGRDCAVRFFDVNLDEWFRLARYVDGGARV